MESHQGQPPRICQYEQLRTMIGSGGCIGRRVLKGQRRVERCLDALHKGAGHGLQACHLKLSANELCDSIANCAGLMTHVIKYCHLRAGGQ